MDASGRSTAHSSASLRYPALRWRRALFFAMVLSTGGLGSAAMYSILSANGLSPLEGLILLLFALTLAWISIAFWTALVGFVLQLLHLDPLSLRRGDGDGHGAPLHTRVAVVMPVHNEDPGRVLAGLEAVYLDLQAVGQGSAFDFYLLSDTTDTEIAGRELQLWHPLRRRLRGDSQLFYRRRNSNEGRKAGNIADFCCRWGANYECMVVLDADSLMSGELLMRLAREMQVCPTVGMIQTMPVLVRQETLFGRFLQFASSLHGPMLASGLSFWQVETANYWGHNAIIRTRAFLDCCGLPKLPGAAPLGGEILSHDFVEAALMRRGGWQVLMRPELHGSFEEVPGNVLDYAARDRRWAEGNLQHLRLLAASGLHPLSRLHFLLGAFGYLCSFLWLLMLLAGSADAMGRAVTAHDFFHTGYQMFPEWPVIKVREILWLLAAVIGLLLLPKLLGLLLGLLQAERRNAFGGSLRLIGSAIAELLLSILLAPVMMSFQSWFVACILCGRSIRWDAPARDAHELSWRQAIGKTWIPAAAGAAWGIGAWLVSPLLFVTLLPVLIGLISAAPLVQLTSRVGSGLALRQAGLLLSPSETEPHAILRGLRPIPSVSPCETAVLPVPQLPPQRLRAMPVQSLDTCFRRNDDGRRLGAAAYCGIVRKAPAAGLRFSTRPSGP
jgi:membrane glycosyltransferase